MDELTRIKGYLRQNQKIIRFNAEAVSLDGFEEPVIKKYNEDAKTVQDYSVDIDGFRSSFAEFQNSNNQSLIDITENGIKLSVKKQDIVEQLNSELAIDGNAIRCITKKFLVDTSNFKVTENALVFNGIVHGAVCSIGNFKIDNHVMTGGASSTISSGTINCKRLELKNAVPELIECNPDSDVRKVVTMTSNKRLDVDEKEDTQTSVEGELNVSGSIYATNGWDDEEHGTPYSLSYHYIICKSIALMSKSGSYSTKNRLRCSEVYSTKEDDTWSDSRLKRNVETLGENATEFYLDLKPKHYIMRKSRTPGSGFIAQEVKESLENHDLKGIVERDGEYYGLRYPELLAFRIKAIQENQKIIEKLRTSQ